MMASGRGTMNLDGVGMRHAPWMPWWRWILALLVVLILLAPLFIYPKDEVNIKRRSEHKYSNVSVVLNPNAEKSDCIVNLYQWLKVSNPAMGAHPDFKAGFSHYPYGYEKLEDVEYPEYAYKPMVWPRRVPNKAHENIEWQDKRVVLAENWRPSNISLIKIRNKYPSTGYYWRINGQLIKDGIPALNTEDLAYLRTSEKVVGNSEFEMIGESNWEYPRIVLRQSCGDPKLDNLGFTAILKYLESNNFYNWTAASNRIEIDWQRGGVLE